MKKKYNFFLIFLLFFSFIKNQNESIENNLPICSESDIKPFVTKCDKNLKQNVLFSKPINCDSSSLKIPNSIINIDCIACNSGEFTSYDIANKKLICLKCNKNSFSTNNFRIDGELNEWTKKNIKEFKNECFIKNYSSPNQYCSNFHSNNLKNIISGNPYNYNEPVFYIAQLSKNFELFKKTELKFKYKKGTIIRENLNKNGVLIVYLDYSIYLIDNDLKSVNEYQEISIELEKGNHTILFKYSKTVSDKISENMSLEISKIEIKDIKINNNICTPCDNGYFTLDSGSEFCQKCEEGKYFENDSCKECPIGKYSKYGETCIDYPNCIEKDYIKIKEKKCINNKQKINNKLINLKCIEKDLKLKNYEEFIECEECPIGKYFKILNENEKECVSCANNTFTDDINSNECKICDGIIKKVSYFEIENYSNFNKTIELEDEGLITVDFNLIEEKEKYYISLKIDNSISIELTKNSNSYFLEKGEHNISINSNNIVLNSIQITNTIEGSGYQCNICPENLKIKKENNEYMCKECEPGYEFNDKKKECIKCLKNDVKASKGNEEKCHTCPTFTTANEKNTECIPYDVYYHSKENLKFYIKQYDEIQNILCSYKQLCFNTLFGPINVNNDLYFLSYHKSTQFKNSDYIYRHYEISNKYKKSFVFLLKILNNTTKEKDFIKNEKYLISLGSEIKNIKLLKNNNNRGVFIHYNNGDKCIEDNTKNYETYLFLKCKNDHNNKKNIKGPKFINKAECVYYFEWEGRGGCPICLSEEIEKIEFQCRNWERNVSYFENNHCVIYNTSQFLGNNIGYVNNEIIINENDASLLNIYNINFQNINNNNQNGYFVENNLMTEYCTILHDYDNTIFKIVICFIIFYGFLIFILVLFIIKYKKTIKSYSILNVNEDDNHSIFGENKSIKKGRQPQIIEISVERNYEKK